MNASVEIATANTGKSPRAIVQGHAQLTMRIYAVVIGVTASTKSEQSTESLKFEPLEVTEKFKLLLLVGFSKNIFVTNCVKHDLWLKIKFNKTHSYPLQKAKGLSLVHAKNVFFCRTRSLFSCQILENCPQNIKT